jgi:class 3 adenylate cyclase
MPERTEPHFANGVLLLADISGYTSFLERVAEAHPDIAAGVVPVPPAYDFMITLLDLVGDGLQPTFTPVQIEGDAVFAVADADAVTNRGREVVEIIGATYGSYHARIADQHRQQSDGCSACILLPSLELKFIVHAGTFVVQQLPTRTHVAGPAVNLAHRLLKNRVTDETGLRGYALMTDAALELLGLDPSEGTTHLETYADAGSISGTVIGLTRSASQTVA